MAANSGKRRHYQYKRYGLCKDCKVRGTYSHPLSARGLCNVCGEARLRASIRQQAKGFGPVVEKWRWNITRAILAGTGVRVEDVLVRDVTDEGCTNVGTKRNVGRI